MRLFKGCKDGVHKFEPRYDKSAANAGHLGSFRSSASAVLCALEKTRSITYVRDVCVCCGRTLERNKELTNDLV